MPLLVLLLLQVVVDGAYLNPNSATSAAAAAAPPVKNERYTFLTRPREKYFTSTGILPPLAPSSHDAAAEEDANAQSHSLVSPLPPRSASSSSQTITPSNQEPEIWVTYTNDPKTVDDWLCKNIPYDGCFLGFDIERLPEARSEHPHTPKDRSAFAHAAVVQLATPTACLVVHLVDSSYGGSSTYQNHPKHSNACARILKKVLEDPSIVKAGCSIDEDLVLLHELWRKSPQPQQQHHSGSGSWRNQQRNHRRPKHKSKRGSSSPTSGQHPHHRNPHNHHPNHGHHHGPSLHARSRFDLGCVVLPKTDSVAGFVALNDTMASWKEEDSQFLHHKNYKFVAKRTTTIANKSGLRGLCKSVLGVDLPKEKEHCASDWTQFPLGDDQITYAARDAWAGVAIATQLASLNVETTQSSSSTESSNTRNTNDNQQTNTKSNVFLRSNLIQVLRKAETPLPQLAYRHRQRKEAKSELQTLLHPYARNLVLNQQNRRRHQQQHQIQAASATAPLAASRNITWTYSHNNTTNHTNFQDDDKGDDAIDVEALFSCYPLASRRTLANYAQQQQQLMEKSLPKRLKKRTLILRQTVNAKVIDHKVVFEIDMVDPTTHQRTAKGSHGQNANTNAKNPRRLSSQQQQQQHRSRNHKRRNQHRRTRNPK